MQNVKNSPIFWPLGNHCLNMAISDFFSPKNLATLLNFFPQTSFVHCGNGKKFKKSSTHWENFLFKKKKKKNIGSLCPNLTFPGFTYRHTRECEWTIVGAGWRRVHLEEVFLLLLLLLLLFYFIFRELKKFSQDWLIFKKKEFFFQIFYPQENLKIHHTKYHCPNPHFLPPSSVLGLGLVIH